MGHENAMDDGSFSSALAGHLSVQSCLLICRRQENHGPTNNTLGKEKQNKTDIVKSTTEGMSVVVVQ